MYIHYSNEKLEIQDVVIGITLVFDGFRKDILQAEADQTEQSIGGRIVHSAKVCEQFFPLRFYCIVI